MIFENKETLVKITIANLLMLLFGFLGETGKLINITDLQQECHFLYMYSTQYMIHLQNTVNLVINFMVFTFIWLLYAVVYLMNPVIKNNLTIY